MMPKTKTPLRCRERRCLFMPPRTRRCCFTRSRHLFYRRLCYPRTRHDNMLRREFINTRTTPKTSDITLIYRRATPTPSQHHFSHYAMSLSANERNTFMRDAIVFRRACAHAVSHYANTSPIIGHQCCHFHHYHHHHLVYYAIYATLRHYALFAPPMLLLRFTRARAAESRLSPRRERRVHNTRRAPLRQRYDMRANTYHTRRRRQNITSCRLNTNTPLRRL